jgi:membrane protease YdiL (CAAX protease family)
VSVRTTAEAPTERADLATAAILVGAAMLLLTRPTIAQGPAPALTLSLCYLAIGAAAMAIPVTEDVPVLRPSLVLLAGVLAVLVVVALVGPGVPIRSGWTGASVAALAGIAEEALFRRLLYDRLARGGAIAAVVGSALAFALLHAPLYGIAVLPVDLGAGLLLSWQRWASGTWTVPAATHVAAQLLMGVV